MSGDETLEVEIEYYPIDSGEPRRWWCTADPRGVSALAPGDTAWEALANAVAGLPAARERTQKIDAFLGDLLAGQVACQRCGKPIEPPDAEHPMCSLWVCRSCL